MITFETEHATVLLPETQAITIESEKARQAIDRDRTIRRSHLFPLFDAVAHFACSLLMAPQGCAAFKLPRAPWIISIGDDMHFAWGPEAFPAQSLDTAIKDASAVVLIASGPDPYPYRVAGTLAVRDRQNVLLIETLPHQMEAWRTRIDSVRAGKQVTTFMAVPSPSVVPS